MSRMQSWMMMSLLLGGCASQTATVQQVHEDLKPASDPVWSSTGDRDIDVTAIALLELLSNERATFADDGQKVKIVISSTTNGSNAYLSFDQFRSEWKDFSPPADAVRSLMERNEKKSKLGWKLPEGQFVFAEKDLPWRTNTILSGEKSFEEVYPDAAISALLWLPGYSADGKTALVRFSFGPTPHGASGSYMLKQRADGTWKIVSRKLAFYV